MNVGILVGTLVFNKIININTYFARQRLVIIDTHHDTGGINVIN